MEQRHRHIYILDAVLDVIWLHRTSIRHLSLAQMLIWAITQLGLIRKWEAPTALLSNGANLLACLSRLDQYTPPLKPINLNHLSEWRDAMSTWTRLAFQYQPRVTEVSREQIRDLLPYCSTASKVLLIISWLHAARVGNAFKLRKENFHFEPQSDGLTGWTVTWNAAKTTKKVGPYTTHSSIPREWYEIVRTWFQRRGSADLVFPHSRQREMLKEIRTLLKERNPLHDLRSIRRGSLCAMAKEGTPIETLLVFSGHKSVDMLLRYIQRGRASGDRATKGAQAARIALH
jgi:hypothetical protein